MILRLLERNPKGMTAKKLSTETGIFLGSIYGHLADLRFAGDITAETIHTGEHLRPATLYRRKG